MTLKIFSNEKQNELLEEPVVNNEELIFTGFEREEEYKYQTDMNKELH